MSLLSARHLAKKYGAGSSSNVYSMMMGHLATMSREIAMIERMPVSQYQRVNLCTRFEISHSLSKRLVCLRCRA